MNKTIAVLGSGPAGLLVAHAVQLAGGNPVIFSSGGPSVISGAQFLHTAIPELTDGLPDGRIDIWRTGSEDIYRNKVYRDPYQSTSWPDDDASFVEAWNLESAYDRLWDQFKRDIQNVRVSRFWVKDHLSKFLAIFSTIPKHQLIEGIFKSVTVHVIEDRLYDIPPMSMMYNGNPLVGWYRASNIWDKCFFEYPEHCSQMNNSLYPTAVIKPLRANVQEPIPLGLYFFGRYGRWEKSELVSHAFYKAYGITEELLHEM